MAQVLRSLDSLATAYTVFEKDQLLTHGQLNSLTGYFDDQDRLTRVALLGVGIVCGLRPTLDDQGVRIGRGVGVTTDGDLLLLPADARYTRYALYTPPAPDALPQIDGVAVTAFELRPDDAEDAAPLADFATATGGALRDMVAVLVAQTYVEDHDLCTGTDCDNLGQDAVHTLTVLLVDAGTASQLREDIDTPRAAVRALDDVVPRRPQIGRGITTESQLVARYRDACDAMHAGLESALRAFYPACGRFLERALAGDPTKLWIGRLVVIRKEFGANRAAIQYYYDFLKDLIDTWAELCSALADDQAICCPALHAFPKHLLLGLLAAGADPHEYRTGFYPSPAVDRGADRRRRPEMLVRRLDTMLRAFALPPPAVMPIRVTPSRFEDRPLGERAIPYYYRPDYDPPLHRWWSQALTERGRETSNFSYHSGAYGAQGAAADPLAGPLARFDHFRIEGHLGQNVARVVELLQGEIAGRNLPFTLRAVHLGSDRARITLKPPIRFTDLHRIHELLRRDVADQLDEVHTYSGLMVENVRQAVADGTITTDQADIVADPVGVATRTQRRVEAQVSGVQLNVSFAAYRQAPGWQARVSDTVDAAAEFKRAFGNVARTEYETPLDTVIGGRTPLWLDRLDDIIRRQEETQDDKLLFDQFVADHPGLEHIGGVLRGGTFVLIYDTSDTVIADVALPYRWEEASEPEPAYVAQEPKPPSAVKPKPKDLLNRGLILRKPPERYVTAKLNDFRVEVQGQWNKDFQRSFDDFKRVSLAADPGRLGGVLTLPPVTLIENAQLLESVSRMESQAQRLDILSQRLESTTAAAERATIKAEIAATELQLADAVAGTMNQVVKTGNDASPQGMAAAAAAAIAAGRIKDNAALQRVDTELTTLQPQAKPTMLLFIEGMKKPQLKKTQLKKTVPRKRRR
ncbi:MAG: hypothetical protein ABI629_00720 [bacterium]